MKRLLLLALVVLWSIPQWAASAVLTTNGSSCPGTTNTTAIVVNLPEDKGGATLTVAGTWTGTISFYGTGSGGINGGGIWTALSVLPIGSSTAVTSTTANGTWQVNVAGFTGVCMLSSASMTGSATVTITPSAASARSNGGSSSGSGTVTSVLGTANQVDVTASTTTPTVSLDSAIVLPGTLSSGNSTNAGSGIINLGFPGTNNTSVVLLDFPNQNNSGVDPNVRLSLQSVDFVGTIPDNIIYFGHNFTYGGGAINASYAFNGWQLESSYYAGNTYDPQNEWHYVIGGPAYTSSPASGSIRPFTTANFCNPGSPATHLTCQTDFMTFRTDDGITYDYLTGDGTNVTASAAWTSASGGTFTYTIGTGDWAVDYQVGTGVTVQSCSTTAYNSSTVGGWTIAAGGNGTTTFTVTGVGSNPGSSATGCSVQGGFNYNYAGVTPSATGGPKSVGGFYTEGTLGVQSGGQLLENASGNATAGLSLYSESGTMGGSSNTVVFHAGGTSLGTCSATGGFFFPGTAVDGYYCPAGSGSPVYLGTANTNNIGIYHVGSGLGLAMQTAIQNGSSNGGVAINTNCGSSDCTTNGSGLWVTSNGGGSTLYVIADSQGTPSTAITTMVLGGWTGVGVGLYGGTTKGLSVSSSGVVGYGSSATAGVSVSGILCTASFATVSGGVTVCTATSDPRLKDIHGPVKYGLNAIMQITPIEFVWNELGRKYNADDTSIHLGFNAANIQAVMPEAVSTEQHDGVDYLSLPHGTDGIVAALVNAVKEQQAEIEQLKAEVGSLKERQ